MIGSANMDMVVEVDRIPAAGETVLGGDLHKIPGGKGANQAVAVARLGRSVAMVGRVGGDENGEMLRAALEHDGVDTTHLITTPEVPTGVALIAVGPDGDNSIVVSPGANTHLGPDDLVLANDLISQASCVLLQLEIPIAAVAAGARAAHRAPSSRSMTSRSSLLLNGLVM